VAAASPAGALPTSPWKVWLVGVIVTLLILLALGVWLYGRHSRRERMA
jgi:hypothetical protein